jgi:4-carboxymuconolactone decarboxylase
MRRRAIHAVAGELHRTRAISDGTYAVPAEQALGRKGMVDLIGILRYYTLVSMTPECLPGADPGRLASVRGPLSS